MKITQNSSPPRPAATGTSGPGRASASSRSTGAAPASGVATPDAAARLTELEAQFSQADFNAAKVGEISAAITAGRYQVDAGAVADKLLASAASMAKSRS
jgi:negative regulator of flagellin synthesis FlgM